MKKIAKPKKTKKNIPRIRIASDAQLLIYKKLKESFETLLILVMDEVNQNSLSTNIFYIFHYDICEKIIFSVSKKSEYLFSSLRLKPLLKDAFSLILNRTRKDFEKQMTISAAPRPVIVSTPNSLIDLFVKEHTKLIRKLNENTLAEIEQVLLRGLRNNLQYKSIARDLKSSVDISIKRSLLIARNAAIQYSGALTKHNQTSVGIKQYKWETSMDERVRSSHKARNNKIYNWSDKGPHPRQEINCRCDAIPIIDS
jgi:SPP1 gp7 family putative phage head morphogenesis protein